MSSGQPRAAVPRDLGFQRGQQIELLQMLLGLPSPTGGSRLGGAVQGGDPLSRLESFFGTLGSPATGLQRQTAGDISSFLRQPAPEQRALDISLPALQEILTGQGPQFERDISLANQQGGRFGSANAILRGEAFRNLTNQRLGATQQLGMLSQAAGQNPFARLLGGFGVGQEQAGQQDIETQRRLQLLTQLLGVQQGNVFNVPLQQGGGLGSLLGGLGGLALGSFLGPLGSAAGSQLGSKLFGGGG